MLTTYQFLKQLLALSEQFEQQTTQPEQRTIVQFAAWLNRQVTANSRQAPGSIERLIGAHETVESVVSKLIGRMNRYAKYYVKKGLEASPLLTFDDFTFLASLLSQGSLTKMELIEKNVHEKPAGIEIIKRLLKNGLVTQADDPEDKRSKRLSVTPKGQQVMGSAFRSMEKVATLATGNLTKEEKVQLLYLLQKLEDFHNPIYRQAHQASIEALLQEKVVAK